MTEITWDVCWEYPGGRMDSCDADRTGEADSVDEVVSQLRAYCSGTESAAWQLSVDAEYPDLVCSEFVKSKDPSARVRWWALIQVDEEHDAAARDAVLAALNKAASKEVER